MEIRITLESIQYILVPERFAFLSNIEYMYVRVIFSKQKKTRENVAQIQNFVETKKKLGCNKFHGFRSKIVDS